MNIALFMFSVVMELSRVWT